MSLIITWNSGLGLTHLRVQCAEKQLLRLWKKPVSYQVYSAQTSHYSSVLGYKEHGYGSMPKVVEMLASYLSPESTLSLKALPTKLVRTTSALVGKAYSAAGQAAACLHTMSLLQAYQADLLGDLDESRGIGPDAVTELHRATDLTLKAIEVTERRLWLNLSAIKEKDKRFLMMPRCPLLVYSVRMSTQSVIGFRRPANRRRLSKNSCHSQVSGVAEREQPQTLKASSSHRATQK